jgi:transposase
MTEEEDRKRLQSLYAGRHKGFLAKQHPDVYVRMEREGTLKAHLEMRGQEAADYYLTLEAQMKEKAQEIADPRARESYLNSIPFTVAEIVREEIVHAWP